MWHFSALLSCIVSLNKKRKEKEKKRNGNNDLAVLPSHDSVQYTSSENKVTLMRSMLICKYYLLF